MRIRMHKIEMPLLVQEMRIRQRGIKPFITSLVYVAVLAAITILFLVFSAHRMVQNEASRMGQLLFMMLSMAQMALITLIVPAYSAGSVSSERERHAFDLLALTLLSSSTIITQKLSAALLQALMLIFASLPVVCVVFMLGGVSPLEVVITYALLILSAVMFSSFGIFCSCICNNSRSSTFLAYLFILGFLIGIPIIGEILRGVLYSSSRSGDTGFLVGITGGFAFICGVISLFLYACLSPVFKRIFKHWRIRAFRMALFGMVYIITTLLLSNSAVSQQLIDTLYFRNTFLLSYVNPFYAISMLNMYNYYGMVPWFTYAIATAAFAIILAYFFRYLSIIKFQALRCRA